MQNNSRTARNSAEARRSWPNRRCCALLLMLVAVLAAVHPAAAQLGSASCFIRDAELGPPPPAVGVNVCNSTCRAATLAALEGIYDEMGGTGWNFNIEDDTGEKQNKGGWMECPATGCSPASVELEGAGPLDRLVPSYCCWEGVLCCHEHSIYATTADSGACAHYSVFMLQLRAGNLTQTMTPAVMEHLQTLHSYGLIGLDLSRNYITGTLPEKLNDLDNLQLLLLGANNISGSVPDLSSLNQLRQLDLEFNFLEGSVQGQQLCPPGNRLHALMLRANNFTGPLDLRTCQNLTVVDLQDNGFSGRIPLGRANMALHILRARNNYFEGKIPDDFWELPQLITVDLSNNSLTGTLAKTIGTTSFLTNLILGGNELKGTIPAGLTTSSQLTNVDLSNNAWIVGSMPNLRWMLGLQTLDVSNTRIQGTIPEEMGNLPFLMSVDIRNTLMTCCRNLSSAQSAEGRVDKYGEIIGWQKNRSELLPPFLQFNVGNKRSPFQEPLPRDPFLRKLMSTGENLLCPTVRRSPHAVPNTETVYRPADLSNQQWFIDPEYYWFQECDCAAGYDSVTLEQGALEELWCEDRQHWLDTLGVNLTDNHKQCTDMSLQVCRVHQKGLNTWQYVLVSLAALAVLCLLIMLASLFVSLCLARTGKVRRQLEWWRKHLSGMPQVGKMSIVVTDIEGYSDLFKRCPEPMYEALTLHNNIIRRAKYANCGSTVQQEGDSYTLVFHEPLDAVAFCLQAQLALMEVAWPEGLYEDSSQHKQTAADKSGMRTRSRGRSKLLGDGRKGSLLPSGPSGWLRKSRGSLKQSASNASVVSVGPPSPTASVDLDKQQPTSPVGIDTVGGSAGLQQASSMAWRSSHNISRTRMLELFSRVTGSNGGMSEAALFNGLRVRMGIVTGVVEGTPDASAPAANIMNSALYKLALDVSDAGSGGQVLMDEATFNKVKEDLRPLGAVTSSGINYNKLAERVSLFHLLCLGSLCSRRSHTYDLDEAMVLDMGQYETPAAATAADKKAPAVAGPPKLAGMLVRASIKLTGWGHSHGGHSHGGHSRFPHTRSLTIPEASEPDSSENTPHSLPGALSAPQTPAPSAAAVAGRVTPPGFCPACRSPTGGQPGSPHKLGGDFSANVASKGRTSPDLAAAAAAVGAGGVCSVCCSASSGGGKRVRLIQVLSPNLVGRAHVWGNKLSIRSTWVCVDAPYFEAPGALEAPLGTGPPTRASSRHINDSGVLATGTSVTPASNSFVSVAASQQSAPQLMQQQQQQIQLSKQQLRHSADGSLDQQQQQTTVTDHGPDLGAAAAAVAAAAAAAAASSIDSTGSLSVAGAAGEPQAAALSSSSSGSRAMPLWPSIQEETSCKGQMQQQLELSQQQQHQQQHQQQQQVLTVSSFSLMAQQPPPQQQQHQHQPADVPHGATAAAVAAARLLRQPIPPVTMVFMLVEGAKVFGQRRKQLVKDIHAELSQMLMLALKHVPGGYMCRMQEGDLKYMVAFPSARAALEWCLMVQEASMYLDWPAGLSKIPQLRSEYDTNSQLVFRGPRIKMGVCEGVPQSIIPNHEGRADYHGSSINQAARFMDAAAHGGQIACELDLALGVVQQWTAPPAAASRCSSGSSMAAAVSSAAAAAVAAAAEGAAGAAVPSAVAAIQAAADAGAVSGAGSGGATLRSLDSSVHRQPLLPSHHHQQQQQGNGVLTPGLSAATSMAAEDDSRLLAPAAAAAAADSGSAAGLVVEATVVDSAALHSTEAAAVVVGSPPCGSSSSSRFHWLFKGGSTTAAAAAAAAAAGTAAAGAQLQQAASAQTAAAAEAEEPPRLFQLPEDQVDRAPIAVEVHHLGLYKFKGSPQPLSMVNVTLASLSGRLLLFPKDPPKGKGGRVAAKEGLVARCEASIPTLPKAYRARVASHVLERTEFIPAVHPIPSSPRRQMMATRSSSMPPVRSFNARSRSPSLNLQQQQQQRAQDLQLAALEGGFGVGQTRSNGQTRAFSSSSGPSSPLGSPDTQQNFGRSGSFTAKLFGKQGGSVGNGVGWASRSPSPSAASAAAGVVGSKDASTGDVVLQMGRVQSH